MIPTVTQQLESIKRSLVTSVAPELPSEAAFARQQVLLIGAALDFLIRDELNARMGLLLVPMGFLNEVHEPPFYYGVNRPDVERLIIPSTWREGGAGLFGRIGDMVQYKLYAITSMNAAGFDDSGLRGGRQNGNRALAEEPGPEFYLSHAQEPQTRMTLLVRSRTEAGLPAALRAQIWSIDRDLPASNISGNWSC